jgi:predicted nucleic acid-binding protein
MSVAYFLDTNVLIYAAMGRQHAEPRRKRARELIIGAEFGTSAQVMQEFYSIARRKAQVALSAERTLAWLERLEKLPFVDTDIHLVKAAALICERYRISYWDACVLAAADRLGAPILYTEDLNHGQSYGAVRVENPFRDL